MPPNALVCLNLLCRAYPDKTPPAETLHLYAEMLADIPAYLLEAAVRAHIAASPWFPKINELRDVARQISGRSSFDSLPSRPVDQLAAEAIALEDAYYHEGELDEAAWEHLAQLFERSGRLARCQAVRDKYQRLAATP